jgi:hypothetical protein
MDYATGLGHRRSAANPAQSARRLATVFLRIWVLTEYLRHYNTARPHRALGQLTPAQAETCPPQPVNFAEHRIRRKLVLSGLTHEYYIAA